MEERTPKELDLDIIKHLEQLSSQVNKAMAERTQNALRRYPILFGLLILVGATSLHEGLKGVMKNLGFFDINPLYLLIAGIFLLIITGTLYKKLDK